MTVILQDDHLATEAWASCGHIWTLSYIRLCGLVVDHRRAGAKDLRFASLMGTCNFFIFFNTRDMTKMKPAFGKVSAQPAFFSDGSVTSQHVPLAHTHTHTHTRTHTHTHTHTRHINVTHVTFILSSRGLRLQVNYAIRMSWLVHIMSFWGVRFISSTV